MINDFENNNELEQFNLNNLNFLTQYAQDNETNENVLKFFNEKLASLTNNKEKTVYFENITTINNLLNENGYKDEFNQKIYDLLTKYEPLDTSNKLNKFLETYKNDPYELLGFNEYLNQEEIIYGDDLIDLVDEDLKQEGLRSRFIRIIEPLNKVNTEQYLSLNAYINEIHEHGDIDALATEYLNNITTDALAKTLDLKQIKTKKITY